MSDATPRLANIEETGPFEFRWPDAVEDFARGWEGSLFVDERAHRFRHGLGGRVVYGRWRVHSVTWLDDQPQVEGVEADDYPLSHSLISGIRREDRKFAKTRHEVPPGYETFELVDHDREIVAPRSRRILAVKLLEDDLVGWSTHAWLRLRQRQGGRSPQARRHPLPPPEGAMSPSGGGGPLLPSAGKVTDGVRLEVVTALLAYEETLASGVGDSLAVFTPDARANELVHADPFAFLVAVICDQGIVAERAWEIPFRLLERLGHLDPERIAAEPGAVVAAFQAPPKLHRFVNDVPRYLCEAAGIVAERFSGDVSRLWSDRPSASELRARFEALPGIGQKKAAMAVELLERYLHVPIEHLDGSDIAFDVHVRRVFLRSGLADRDDVGHMVSVARRLHAERPGALDNPAWWIGRTWCRPAAPDCGSCSISLACPKLVFRGDGVHGA